MNNKGPISFRLDSESRGKLEQKAEKLGVRVGELARKVVIQSLDEESELARLKMRIASLEETISGFREDLAVAVKALLVTKGAEQVVTPDQAESWVSENMRSVG